MVKVKLVDLHKYFGKVKAVVGLNLTIDDGEFVALLGPSGCGKTTTLLMIAGIYKPTKGYIYFDDVIVNDLPPKDRNIGMVFQSYALYPHMTVFDNIAFPLKLRKEPKQEIRKKVREVAELLQISELLDRKPGQLSGGQQQRVALARALVKEPNLFLMDEPLSNLDAKLRVTMRAELKRLQKQLGITTIYVTHDQVEAMTMADRIAILNKGILQQVGRPEELYDKPANLFVAGFIGSPPMNFVECSLNQKGDDYFLEGEGINLKVNREIGKIIVSSGVSELILGVRPEDLEIGRAPDTQSITGEVYVLEPLGRDVIVNVKVGNNMLKVLAPQGFKASPGEKVALKLKMERMHIFDKRSGKAIV